jgi:hypothetical protein
MISPERIWRTVDGSLVADGHPDAAFLVAGVGGLVDPAYEAAVSEFVKSARPEKPAAEPVAKPVAKRPARKPSK